MPTVKPKIHAGHAVCLCLSLLLGAILALFGEPVQPAVASRGGVQTGWGITGNLNTERFLHTATLLADGRVLVVGGIDNNFTTTRKAELYDPAAKVWSATGDLIDDRLGHSATLLADGRVLVAGGAGLSSAEIYNPATGTWSAAGSLSVARNFHTATLLANGKVLVAGGNDSAEEPINSAELFDPAANGGQGNWSVTGQMNTARQSHIAARLANGKVLVAGGGGEGSSFLKSAELYDPAAGTWSATGELNTARLLHSGTLLANGRVLAAGGLNGSVTLRTAEIYDPIAGTWGAAGNLNTARYAHTATLLANNQALIAGGVSENGTALTNVELFDPLGGGGQGSFVAVASLNIAREEHTATLLAGGQILVAGGVGASSVLNSAELFNLVSTCPAIAVNPTTIPPGTIGAAYPATTFTQSGGVGTIAFNQIGTLPVGMTFSGNALSGTPAQPGSFPITITATDVQGCAGRRDYTLVINCLTITINPAAVSSGIVGKTYSQTFTQGGGTGAATFSLTGTLPAGLFFSPSGVLSGIPTQPGAFPIIITATDSNNCAGSRNYTLVVSQDPGAPLPASSEGGGQKAGSVLFYNFFTSTPSNQHSQNTRFSVTNTNGSQPASIRLFFVDGSNGSTVDGILCLTPNQTSSFLASDLDPGTTGYLIAVAIDGATGCPVSFNFLIGDEYVKLSSGHAANLGAEAFAALTGGLPACGATSQTAVLRFDGTQFNLAPAALSLDNISDRASGNDTLLVVNRVGGDLVTGVGAIGLLTGELYDDVENAYSFAANAGACQFRAALSSQFPRTAPRFEQVIAAGRSGWMKFWEQRGTALLGAAINFNPVERSSPSAYTQGHNLHHLRLTTAASLTIPVFPPSC